MLFDPGVPLVSQYTVVTYFCIPSISPLYIMYPGYSYPHTPDIDILVPLIFIPSHPGYSYPRTPDIHTLATPDIHTLARLVALFILLVEPS